MARIYHCGFEVAVQLEFSAGNASNSPTVTFPTPGRSGITGTRYRLVTVTGFGGGTNFFAGTFRQTADEIYGQFVASVTGGGGSTYGFQIRDASGNNIASAVATAGHANAWAVTFGTATSGGTASEGYTASAWKLFEFYLKIDPSAGEFTIKKDGIQIYTFTGNTDPNSRPVASDIVVWGGGFQSNFWLDDVIINDTTGSEQNSWVNNETLLLLIPNGNGDSSELLGSDGNSTDNYLLVDDFPHDSDSTHVAADDVNLKDLYELSSLPTLPAGSAVRLVEPIAIARRADPGTPSNIDVGIKSDDTEDFEIEIPLATTYALHRGVIYYEDPDDEAAWDETKVNALQVGVRSS